MRISVDSVKARIEIGTLGFHGFIVVRKIYFASIEQIKTSPLNYKKFLDICVFFFYSTKVERISSFVDDLHRTKNEVENWQVEKMKIGSKRWRFER